MKHREVLSLLCPRFLTSARLTLYGTSFSSSVILRPILFRINCAPLGGCVLMANSTSSDGKDVFARALSPVNFVAPPPPEFNYEDVVGKGEAKNKILK